MEFEPLSEISTHGIIDYCLDFFFAVDIVVNFRTAFYNSDNEVLRPPRPSSRLSLSLALPPLPTPSSQHTAFRHVPALRRWCSTRR